MAEADELGPQDLINAKPVTAAIKEFFDLVSFLSLWIKTTLYLRLLISESFRAWTWWIN